MKKILKDLVEAGVCEIDPELAEIAVSYKSKPKQKVKILNAQDAFDVLYSLFNPETIEFREEFLLLLLNRANIVLGWFKLCSGGTTGTIVDVKIIFMLALQVNATNVILCHNHPSQNLNPSEADIKLTQKIKEAGNLFDIGVLDHLIISSNRSFYAFSQEGLM